MEKKNGNLLAILYVIIIVLIILGLIGGIIYIIINDKKEEQEENNYNEINNNIYYNKSDTIESYNLTNNTKSYNDFLTNDINNNETNLYNIQESSNKIKKEIDINNDKYYDDLELHVGDIYDLYKAENKIIVFCSTIKGETPKKGDVFHLESKEPNYVYEATLYDVVKTKDSFDKETLRLYFEGVREDDLKFTPQIRRLK